MTNRRNLGCHGPVTVVRWRSVVKRRPAGRLTLAQRFVAGVRSWRPSGTTLAEPRRYTPRRARSRTTFPPPLPGRDRALTSYHGFRSLGANGTRGYNPSPHSGRGRSSVRCTAGGRGALRCIAPFATAAVRRGGIGHAFGRISQWFYSPLFTSTQPATVNVECHHAPASNSSIARRMIFSSVVPAFS